MAAREEQRRADAHNEPLVAKRVAAHLRAWATVLDGLSEGHRRVVEHTDFDPLEKSRQSAAWLLAGRCLSLGYTLRAVLQAGFTVEVSPLARTLHEAGSTLRIMLDDQEKGLHRKWIRDGYFSPKVMDLALKRMEERSAVQMIKQGYAPPGRTDELDRQLYDSWSRIAHNRRSGILESYRADQREFAYGPELDPLRRGVWVGYGTHLMTDVTVTVGAMLAKMFGRNTWTSRIEPLIWQLNRLQIDDALDPSALGFRE